MQAGFNIFFNLYLKGDEIDFLNELEKLKSLHPGIFEIEERSTHTKNNAVAWPSR